jgi:hypothetical protein
MVVGAGLLAWGLAALVQVVRRVARQAARPLGLLLPRLAALLVAGVAGWRARAATAGVEAGLWAGLVASLLFCTGLMAATYLATDWFAQDPATLSSLAYTWSSAHYSEYRHHYTDVATYLIRENADTALVSLIGMPITSGLAGVVGGALGAGLAPLHWRPRRGQR